MKRSLIALAILFSAVAVLAVTGEPGTVRADQQGQTLRSLYQRFRSKVVVLSWSTRTSAMGQNIDTTYTTTGVLVGEGGLFAVSNQPFQSSVSGIAGMFGGRSQASGPENFRVRTVSGAEFDAIEAGIDEAANLRYFGIRLEEGMSLAWQSMPETVHTPEVGDPVVLIGAHDATLNYARFFREARINCEVEAGKYYGLDGSVQDCLGALVVAIDGCVLGVVGQKPAPVGQQQDPTGVGRLLGGINDPSKALGNRVLMTPAVFCESMKAAQEAVLSPDFGKESPAVDDPVAPEPQPEPEPDTVEHEFRGLHKVLQVGESVLKGQYGALKGGIMVTLKPDPGSHCDTAGLKNGDIITKVGDTEIGPDTTAEEFWRVLEACDGVVKMTVVRRGGKSYELEIHTK